MTSFNIHRRHLLKGASASVILAALHASGMPLNFEPDKTYRVGLIGTGWYGKSDLFRLIQIAPVEVVALCDVDKNLLSEAATMVSQRQKSKKKPRLYSDYQKMLSENSLDIVLIGTPDHWHALQTIDAVKAGAHVYVQKPISVDVMEGEAMVAAARKYNKVVQVGTQRKSTPHLIDAKKNIVDAGLLGKISHVEMCCYFHMRNNGNPAVEPVPAFFDYEMWTGPAPMRPYDGLPHIRWWRTFMEYGNGIMGDMCVHMLDTVRWMLKLGWPKRISSTGGILVDKTGKSNIPDTQTAVFEYDNLNCVWQHRSWGTPADPEYPWAFIIYGDKGTLRGSTMKYDFTPQGDGKKIHKDVVYEKGVLAMEFLCLLRLKKNGDKIFRKLKKWSKPAQRQSGKLRQIEMPAESRNKVLQQYNDAAIRVLVSPLQLVGEGPGVRKFTPYPEMDASRAGDRSVAIKMLLPHRLLPVLFLDHKP